MSKKLFDFAIGNPPYQQEQKSQDIETSLKNYAPPVYNHFIDAAVKVADKVELIHPARFLFNAGSTPKAWNEKMLNDEHLKVLHYEPSSEAIFPGTDIKGGIAVTYYNNNTSYGAIKSFSPYPEVNGIMSKVVYTDNFRSIDEIVFSRTAFRLTEAFHKTYPDAKNSLSNGHLYDMSSNIFQRIPFAFENDEPANLQKYVRVLGRDDNKRIYKYIRREFINEGKNLDEYKVFIPQAVGSGKFGDFVPVLEIANPGDASTETFISIGKFDKFQDVCNLANYIKSKFFRCLVSTLKVTQIGNKSVYMNVPMQDFTNNSDINWSTSIKNIDKQLYKKYDLSNEEINFIENNVKEME